MFSLSSQPSLPQGLNNIWPHALQGSVHSWTHGGTHDLSAGGEDDRIPLQPLLW